MATSSDNGGSPAGRVSSQQQPINIPSQGPKRNRRKNNHSAQLDGSVSESNTTNSARTGLNSHHRYHTQPQNINYNQQGRPGEYKQRQPSAGGHGLPGTPAKEQAYAGPTFQASPAASALPVPKFFSRSVPGSTPLSERLDAEWSPEAKQQSPALEVPAPQAVPSRDSQASPLDLFFKADKEEKERTRSQSSNLSPDSARQLRPALAQQNSDSPRNSPGHNRPGPPHRLASADHAPSEQSSAQREAATQSLKDLLFKNPPPAQPTQQTPQSQSNAAYPENPFLSTPSPSQRSTSGPSTPAPNSEQQRNNYALHYGNRNLSPLFMAARGETPPRPSGLRQEVPHHNYSPQQPTQYAPPPFNNFPPQQQHPIDPNQFSRDFLNQHVRGAQPGHFPPSAFPHGASHPSGPPSSSAPPVPSSQHQHGVGGQVPISSSSAAATASSGNANGDDKISSMEDDLRRMLKLNAVS